MLTKTKGAESEGNGGGAVAMEEVEEGEGPKILDVAPHKASEEEV